MLAHRLAAAALLAAYASAAGVHPRILKNDFMRAMDVNEKRSDKRRARRRRLGRKEQAEFRAELRGGSERAAQLRKKIIERSTVVKKPGQRRMEDANANGYGGNYNNGGAYNNNAQWNNNGNSYYYNNPNYWQQHAQQNYNYQVNANDNDEVNYKYDGDYDGLDDYFMAYGEWENEFGFDPTQYSLSYHRCAAVRQFDDQIAAKEDTASVFSTKRFAVFRFCPETTCMGWQEEEEPIFCDKEYYGEDYCKYLEEYAEYMKQTEEQAERYRKQQQWAEENGTYEGYGQNGNGRKLDDADDLFDDQAQDDAAQDDAAEEEEEEDPEERSYMDGYYQMQEEPEMFGARGEGCQNNYGEYMMEMDEYLTLMLEWQEERFEQYCNYCDTCMYKVYEEWLANGGNHRQLTYDEFKASAEHDQIRKLGNNADDEDQDDYFRRDWINFYRVCPEYDTCSEYKNICDARQEQEENGEEDEDRMYEQYFQCQEVQKDNGMVAWVGPHCAEDGFTITLAVYGDEYCNEFIGNGVNIANFLGEELDYEEDVLKSYYNSVNGYLDQLKYINEDNVCIPCRKGGLMWTERDWDEQQEAGQEQSDYEWDDDEVKYDNTEVNEICGSLYEVSARCDKHYRSYNLKAKQAKYRNFVGQEDLTCDFIDSVVMGNYDEMGYINLGSNYTVEGQPGWMGNGILAQQYGQAVARVTPLQAFLLTGSLLAVGIMGAWASTLHRTLSKAGPWRPARRPGFATPQPDLTRQNSGIIMGRSQSNASYYMT